MFQLLNVFQRKSGALYRNRAQGLDRTCRQTNLQAFGGVCLNCCKYKRDFHFLRRCKKQRSSCLYHWSGSHVRHIFCHPKGPRKRENTVAETFISEIFFGCTNDQEAKKLFCFLAAQTRNSFAEEAKIL